MHLYPFYHFMKVNYSIVSRPVAWAQPIIPHFSHDEH